MLCPYLAKYLREFRVETAFWPLILVTGERVAVYLENLLDQKVFHV